jgi:glycosyltransferase involved in cell wall biosynthesis
MKRIVLCMIAPEFFPTWGGVGSYIVELIKHLPRNVDVHVIALRRGLDKRYGDDSENEVNSIIKRPLEIHYVSTARESFYYNVAFQLACLKNIPRLAKEYKFDILHSHLSHMPDVLLQMCSLVKVPTVATVHSTIRTQKEAVSSSGVGFAGLEWSEKNSLLLYPLISLLQKNYAKHVSTFIAVSNVTREQIYSDLKVEKDKISVVYNGVDTELFHPLTGVETGKKYSRPTITYVGRIMRGKGLQLLVDSMPSILRFFPEAHFIFAGLGHIQFYKKMIQQKGISEKSFSFLGQLGYYQRPKIFQDATVFVNPSFFENCSMSILEAMSSGTTVVANRVGGNPELIKSEENGILVPSFSSKLLAQSIISVLSNESLCREIGKKARRTVEERFSSERMAEDTYGLYERVLNGKARADGIPS